jgi:hypothetical protein
MDWLGHMIQMHETRIAKKIFKKLWDRRKVAVKWLEGVENVEGAESEKVEANGT